VRDLFAAVRARGLKTAIATASKKEGLDKVIEATGLDLYALADVVVTDSDVDRSKPYPDVVQAAADKLGVSPAQCVMVGDTPYDILSAYHAGVTSIGLLTGAHEEEVLYQTGARAVYRDAAALLDALDEALERASPLAVHLDAALLERLMQEALGAARRALEAGDLPVGCALARGDGTVLATGHSRTETTGNFLLHGEMVVLHEVADDVARHARDLILVSTLEPCVMCYGAAMEARVETVVYALAAPANGGPARCTPMESPGMLMPRVVGGIRADESRALFEAWLERHPGSPFVADLLARLDREAARQEEG
jgi:tRNA(Arg) A34 adenosine deaminase TadA/predicted HAD superfamily phosphohydrolase YqeG